MDNLTDLDLDNWFDKNFKHMVYAFWETKLPTKRMIRVSGVPYEVEESDVKV